MSCRAIHAKEDGVSLGNDHTTGMTVTTATNNIVTFLLVVLNFKICKCKKRYYLGIWVVQLFFSNRLFRGHLTLNDAGFLVS